MGNNSSSKIKNKSTRPGGAGKSSKLAARIAGRHQSVNYIPQKNHRTPTRTPTRRNDRVNPVPETINQQRFQRDVYQPAKDSTIMHGSQEEEEEEEGGSNYYREGHRVNLCGSRAATDSYEDYDEDFDQAMPSSTLTEGNFSARPTRTANGLDKGRNWISTSGSADKNGPGDKIIDQWPCEIVDTDNPVIFVENRVYIGPSDKDEFKCFDLGQFHHHHYHQQKQCDWDVAPPPYSHSTPKQKKRVLFEKVNYEKYRRVRSQHNYSGDDEDSPRHSPPDGVGGQQRCNEHYAMNKRTTHKHCFSNGEIDRDEYGHQWCQDLLNWSREAAEYQRRRRHQNNQQNGLMSASPPPPPPPLDSMDNSRSSGNWFHDKFRSSSASRYNKMSGTEDSGVVCQFDEDDDEADDDFWGRSKNGKSFSANDNDDVKHSQHVTMAGQKQVEDGVDSWEVLKQKVFEPAESTITPSRIVRDSDGRLLGRRCSCNSMCTSLCTLETWVDDEIFDNNFNEELERRVGRVENGISRD